MAGTRPAMTCEVIGINRPCYHLRIAALRAWRSTPGDRGLAFGAPQQTTRPRPKMAARPAIKIIILQNRAASGPSVRLDHSRSSVAVAAQTEQRGDSAAHAAGHGDVGVQPIGKNCERQQYDRAERLHPRAPLRHPALIAASSDAAAQGCTSRQLYKPIGDRLAHESDHGERKS